MLWIFVRLPKKTVRLQRKCPKGFIPSSLSAGFATVFNWHFFSQIFARIKANKSFFSVELGWPRENRLNSGKLFGTEIGATNWKKCSELSVFVSDDKKKCYGGRSWCIIKGSLVSKLPRYGRLSWPAFSILMHSHHHVNHIIMSTTSTCHSYSWEM